MAPHIILGSGYSLLPQRNLNIDMRYLPDPGWQIRSIRATIVRHGILGYKNEYAWTFINFRI
jgi:hypothetical protein